MVDRSARSRQLSKGILRVLLSPRPFRRLALLSLALVLVTSASVAQDRRGGRRPRGPGGPGGPGGVRQPIELVEKFDEDKDGRLNAAERKKARAHLAEERANGRGSRRFPRRGGNIEPPKEGRKLSPSDVPSCPDASLYDPSVLRTLFLEFASDDWEAEMAEFKGTDVEMPATLTVDGKKYGGIGVRVTGACYLGFVSAGYKRSLNLSMNYVHGKQRLYGYRTLNLLNSNGDPSFLRSVLFSQIARDYLPSPKANLVRVVINGEDWGVYVNQQQFNKDFTQEFFGSKKGARWKAPGSPRGRATLGYLGDDVEEYKKVFSIRTKDDEASWKALVHLTKVISETEPDELVEALEPIFNVDGALRFLAIDNALVNNDGYWTRTSDYNLYRDVDGRFHILPHDTNETLHVPGRRGRGGGRGGAREMGRGDTSRALLAQADKNDDRQVSKDELVALAEVWFGIIDVDKKGSVDRKRFSAKLGEALRAGVTSNPRGGRGRAGAPAEFMRDGMFRAADADKSGDMTLAELRTMLGAWFDDFDREKGGTISERTLADGLRSKLPRPSPWSRRTGRRAGGTGRDQA